MCECLTSSPVTDAGGTAGTDTTGGDGGGTVFGLIGTLCSGVQGDFAVVRVSSVWLVYDGQKRTKRHIREVVGNYICRS